MDDKYNEIYKRLLKDNYEMIEYRNNRNVEEAITSLQCLNNMILNKDKDIMSIPDWKLKNIIRDLFYEIENKMMECFKEKTNYKKEV
jgi:hypothetical protein